MNSSFSHLVLDLTAIPRTRRKDNLLIPPRPFRGLLPDIEAVK
jgi:hypothetical protein